MARQACRRAWLKPFSLAEEAMQLMVRAAVVGYGFMGRTHSLSYKAIEGAELACVIDVVDDKRKTAEQELGVPTFPDLASALDAESFDIVDITLPTYLHADATVEAFAAGKHVLCEKPMALTVEDCERMIAAWKRSGRKFMVAQVLRFWPEYARLKEIVDSGMYGAVKSVYCTRLGSPPLWSWDNWLMDGPRSGGALIDLHVHDIDWVCYMLGRPKAVFATGGLNVARGGAAHVFASYIYDGPIAFAEGGWDMPSSWGFMMACRVQCEGAVLAYASNASPTLVAYPEGVQGAEPIAVPAVDVGATTSGGNISELGGYVLECKYFVDCVRESREPTVVTPEQAMQNIEVGVAEQESIATGTVVTLP